MCLIIQWIYYSMICVKWFRAYYELWVKMTVSKRTSKRLFKLLNFGYIELVFILSSPPLQLQLVLCLELDLTICETYTHYTYTYNFSYIYNTDTLFSINMLYHTYINKYAGSKLTHRICFLVSKKQ